MKYVHRDMGEAHEASSGGGRSGLVREIGVLVVLVAVTLTILYLTAALVTDAAIVRIPADKEQELFRSVAQSFKSDPVPEALTEKWALSERVLARLREVEGVPRIDYTLVFQDQGQANAFAIPGGRIALTRGLLESLDEEIAIAFVLGHELGHFANRDHLRGMGRKVGFSAAVQLMFGGDLAAFSRGGSDFIMNRYSREQERSADAFGVEVLRASYGETGGAERLFEVLAEQDGLPRWAYMFATHPDHQSRIEAIRSTGGEE